ncbi:hypothetical protein [Intrasporangium sp. YIM S08009]|uniref:hypothetical protein n=1 Tax=Intrasporangium zincisolvens TaxID=3080018 RepID=UPI002B05251F|nr:hypothetical protein [Intrasporangium sp. YIM S08009]
MTDPIHPTDASGPTDHPDPADASASPTTPGRLVLVTGADASGLGRLARAVGERLGGALVVDGQALDAMLVGDASAPLVPPTGVALVRRQLLRWSAGLALAETYLIEGHDVVVADRVEGERLEDYLDLAAPQPVHLVVVGAGIDPSTPGWGLWVTTPPETGDEDSLAGTAAEVVERLAESVVDTA